MSQQLRILVVEDEVIIRANLAEILRDSGFMVVEAGSGDEAWQFLLADGNVQLVITDIQMPGKMNGIDLARSTRARFPDIKIIFTSGYAGSDSRPEGMLMIHKPYRMEGIVQLVQNYLSQTL